ncbi:MAG: tryptophan-rich sensory protein [Bacilli bacterium]
MKYLFTIIFSFIAFLFVLFCSFDLSFLETLNVPFFMPSSFCFKICNLLNILFNFLFLLNIIKNDYQSKTLWTENIITIILNTALFFTLFILKNIGLSVIIELLAFSSGLSYCSEIAKIKEKDTSYLTFYLLWSLYLAISLFTLFLLNS